MVPPSILTGFCKAKALAKALFDLGSKNDMYEVFISLLKKKHPISLLDSMKRDIIEHVNNNDNDVYRDVTLNLSDINNCTKSVDVNNFQALVYYLKENSGMMT